MNALFVCFTGTGNTKMVCEALADAVRAQGGDARVELLRADRPAPDPAGADRLIVAFPVHGFNAPAPVLRYLKGLPAAQGGSAWLVRTSGEPLSLNDGAASVPVRLLRKRGWRVAGDLHYVMPYNIIFRHTDGMASRMWRAVLARVQADAARILSDEGELPRPGALARLVSAVCRVEHPAASLIGRGFQVTDSCIGCGLCARNCPQGNIRMEGGRPVFGRQCVICMACAFGCPKDAVRTGLLNGWRVNGGYDFGAPPATDGEICSYCRRSYLKYYHRAETAAEEPD